MVIGFEAVAFEHVSCIFYMDEEVSVEEVLAFIPVKLLCLEKVGGYACDFHSSVESPKSLVFEIDGGVGGYGGYYVVKSVESAQV